MMLLTLVRLETKIFPVTLTDDRLLILAEAMLFGPMPVTFNPPFTKRVDAKSVEGIVGVPTSGG